MLLLDQFAALGFSGVRVFAGHLEWAGQTAAMGVEQLPDFVEACRGRGLYVLVSAITDSAIENYSVETHIDLIGAICIAYDNTLLEIANEPYHETQRSAVHDFAYLRGLAARVSPDVLVGLGAAADDEALDGRDGEFIPIHLDRGRDIWNEVRRVREAQAVEDSTGKPAIIQETTKAYDVEQEGKWESRPEYFYALGVNGRLFEVGIVFHSENGLQAQPLDAATEACARDCVAGFIAIPLDVPTLEYHNAGDPASPVRSANFDNVVRCHSATDGARGWTFAEGIAAGKDPEITWNWPVHEQIDSRPQLRLYAAMR
jgi:hypothetical protein